MKQALRKYARVWLMYANHSFQKQLISKTSSLFFFTGKVLRFIVFIFVLFLLRQQTKQLGQYSMDEIVLFFLTYNFLDLIPQILFRGVYAFSEKVRTGEFDFFLAKPVNPLFRALTGLPDFNDVIFFFPVLGFFLWYIAKTGFTFTLPHVLLYIFLLANGLVLATAFHILVLCLGILTTEVDNAIMLYRDITQTGRIPVDIYRESLRTFLTFIIPVGIMMTVPVKSLLNQAQLPIIVFSVGLSASMLVVSLVSWKYALRGYSSASS